MPPRKMFRAKMMGPIGFTACFQCSFRCETSVAARKVTKTQVEPVSDNHYSAQTATAGGLVKVIAMVSPIPNLNIPIETPVSVPSMMISLTFPWVTITVFGECRTV